MVEVLLAVGVLVAVFVGFNIGGSSTGVAFGPAVGAGTVSKLAAATLMTVSFVLGGWNSGQAVVRTMGEDLVTTTFTLEVGVAILFFVGLALLLSNLFGVPASTSMTAVGAIAGFGIATETLRWGEMGEIVSWWLVAPIMAFWVCAVVGRYLYPYLESTFTLESDGEGTTTRERFGQFLVVAIGCYMAYSAGASNTANAIAPLYGAGAIDMFQGVLVAGLAVGLGAFTIARRTLDTVGNDLTELPILAALIVETVSATIIFFLSEAGIPASLAVSATMCVVGLGWGRASRTTKLSDAAEAAVAGPEEGAGVAGKRDGGVSVNALAAESERDPVRNGGRSAEVARIGEEEPDEITAADLFDPAATGRVVMLWIATPTISAVASYLVFRFLPVF